MENLEPADKSQDLPLEYSDEDDHILEYMALDVSGWIHSEAVHSVSKTDGVRETDES